MEVQQEKIYVAVGKEVQEGLSTLEWTLKNWSSQSISVVILHVGKSTKDIVHTPFGKLPASSVSDETLEVFRICELAQYKALCGKVKIEVLRVENSGEPLHNVLVGLISRLHVTKLVASITCMKTSSRSRRSGISGAFYVHKHKPDYCEVFITCGGKLVHLREENDEGYFDDEEGMVVVDIMRKNTKAKGSSRGWLGKILSDNAITRSPGQTSSSPTTGNPDENWEDCVEEIETYLQWLTMNLNTGEEDDNPQSTTTPEKVESENINPNLSTPSKIEDLKSKLEKVKKAAEENRNETKSNVDRRLRAERVISLCNRRAEMLEAHVKEELAQQSSLKKELERVREEVEEASSDILESQRRLKSASELRAELTNVLRKHSSEKTNMEALLETALIARAETIQEIEELRRERDVLRRRLYFYKERAEVRIPSSSYYNYKELTVDELRVATDNFSNHMRMGNRVYRGKLNHVMVVIKLEDSLSLQSQEEFKAKMRLLCQIRHPNLITVIGACTSVHPMSIVFEYMHNRSLRDLLFRPTRSTPKVPLLPWHARIRIASDICSAVAFLHGTRPNPTPHANLKPSNVLLDRALVAKIADLRAVDPSRRSGGNLDWMIRSDVRDLGVLLLQMLTGMEEVSADEVERAIEGGGGDLMMDERAGGWPLDVAMGFGRLGARCAHVSREGWGMERVVREMEEVRKQAEVWAGADRVADVAESCHDAPAMFLCPILQEVMKQPYVAADGFSYELEAIEEWLGNGHDTSPMTNLKLKNKLLTANHTLRTLIQDWQNNR